jgi:uncharacterized membrane protein YeaQ/YmgE (transglycosylase-associated protein family)
MLPAAPRRVGARGRLRRFLDRSKRAVPLVRPALLCALEQTLHFRPGTVRTMDLIVWLLIGCVVGWASYAFLHFNEKRGVHVSIALGAVGALLGGTLVAPILTFLALAPRDFSRPGLLFAAAVAATVLALGNLVYARWGV